MELQQLIGFVRVARLGGFTRAAEATGRTQSAVSQQVKALEEDLGCPLLERRGRGRLVLTSAGQKVLAFSEKVLGGQEELRRELAELRGLAMGRLTIAAPFTTLYQLMPGLLADYSARHPQVELRVLDRPQSEVIALVRSGRADLGLALASAVPRGLTARLWKDIRPFLIAPAGHPLTALDRPGLADIAAWPLILPPEDGPHPAGRDLRSLFHGQGLAIRVVLESSNVELSTRFAAAGLGVAFASVAADLRPVNASGVALIPLDHLLPGDRLAVISRPTAREPGFVAEMVEVLYAA